jgi:S1-C subfamily serine protease
MRQRLPGVLLLSVTAVSALVSCTGAQKPAAGQQTTPAPAAALGGYADVVERVTPGVVTVTTTYSIGCGVVYRPDVVITNELVVGQYATVTIAFADGTSSGARSSPATRSPTSLWSAPIAKG